MSGFIPAADLHQVVPSVWRHQVTDPGGIDFRRAEQAAVQSGRRRIGRCRPTTALSEVDDFMIRRFLRSREWNLEKAAGMFLKFLKWRRTYVHNGFISEAQIQNELSQRKFFMHGISKKGSPISFAFPSKHYPSKRDLNEFKNFVVYFLDKLCASIPRGEEKLIFIVDFQGWGYSNCDIRGYLACLDILQNYYPERLGKVLLIHVPSLFMKTWKIIYPFIDKKTRNKFIFVEDKNLRASLLEDIDEDQLPDIYGGKLKLIPIDSAK